MPGGPPDPIPPNPGDRFTYEPTHNNGFGHNASGNPLSAEMSALDLVPGTPVTVLELDADSGWPIVQWVDSVNIDRLTTIEPNEFDQDFRPV
jgi:hypothetical protein